MVLFAYGDYFIISGCISTSFPRSDARVRIRVDPNPQARPAAREAVRIRTGPSWRAGTPEIARKTSRALVKNKPGRIKDRDE
jgi:hypothetical protein